MGACECYQNVHNLMTVAELPALVKIGSNSSYAANCPVCWLFHPFDVKPNKFFAMLLWLSG